MTAMATHQLKKSIADLGVPEVPEFLEQIVASGGHLWACRMSADMSHLDDGRPLRRGRGIISASRLHREDRGRPAALHLSEPVAGGCDVAHVWCLAAREADLTGPHGR